ncbi:MAG: glycoside hydrolase family 20 zincin-like fold domain-containing protein [Iamia sp.]
MRERTTQALPEQGFRLSSSSEDGVRLEHRDPAGLRYGRQLLQQVIAQCADGRLPGVTIEDSPDIPVRALMLDISRDRVPTLKTLERLVRLCSLARINQLQLYIEHTFAHPAHREVWQYSSPMTPAHLTWLDRHCAEHGIELVANQNTFGHMGRWLSHDAYRDRAECPDGWEPVPGMHLPPEVLAPTEDNAAFALGLVDDVLGCVRSTRVNIGCDEPFELGHGASRELVAERGVGRVYIDHVRRLVDPLLDHGYEVQVWADVLTRHPDLATSPPA